MNLQWESYGDTGRTAKSSQGTWVVVTDGSYWHLSYNWIYPHVPPRWQTKIGVYDTIQEAQDQAQQVEDLNLSNSDLVNEWRDHTDSEKSLEEN